MVISDTLCMIEGLPLLYWRLSLGKSRQRMCVMMSRHSCGKNQTVNGSIQGDSCNKDVTYR